MRAVRKPTLVLAFFCLCSLRVKSSWQRKLGQRLSNRRPSRSITPKFPTRISEFRRADFGTHSYWQLPRRAECDERRVAQA